MHQLSFGFEINPNSFAENTLITYHCALTEILIFAIILCALGEMKPGGLKKTFLRLLSSAAAAGGVCWLLAFAECEFIKGQFHTLTGYRFPVTAEERGRIRPIVVSDLAQAKNQSESAYRIYVDKKRKSGTNAIDVFYLPDEEIDYFERLRASSYAAGFTNEVLAAPLVLNED